jgi:hypothetical protein
VSDIDKLTPEEALAEALVDEAPRGMKIPTDVLPFVRVTLISPSSAAPPPIPSSRRAVTSRR